jgi:predicted RNA-binding Zn ribbon-like protein
MRVAISGPRPDPVTPYRYIGGDPSIDFVNTADWIPGGLDRFTSYDRILEWATGASALSTPTAESLRTIAHGEPQHAARVLHHAIALRGLLEQLYFDIVSSGNTTSVIAQLNQRWLSESLAHLALMESGDGTFRLGWPRQNVALESPLWRVSWSAAQLLASEGVPRIRRCGGVDCGWYFVDHSRNGLRRWCEMETCGTQMKSRRRAARHATANAE